MTFREQYFAELYRGYLALMEAQMTAIDADPPFELTDGAVWPPVDVPRVCPHDDAETILPGIYIVADEQPHKHPQIMKMEVFIRLKIQSQLKDGEPVLEDEEDPIDRIGTATEKAQAWMQAITEAVYAGETFRAYLLSLTEAERTGGQIMMRIPNNGIAHVHDAAERTHTWEITIMHDVDVSPP